MSRRSRFLALGCLPFWVSASLFAQAPAAPPPTTPPPPTTAPAEELPPAPKPPEEETPDEPAAPDTAPVPPAQPSVPSGLPASPPQPSAPESVVPRAQPPLANRPLATAPSETETDTTEPELPPLDQSLGLEGLVGFGVRIGGSDVTYSESERVDLTFGLGAWFAPSRDWALGLGSDRTPYHRGPRSGHPRRFFFVSAERNRCTPTARTQATS